MQRRALTAALASATVALGGALAATTVPAQAEDPVSPLVLVAPDRVVARSHDGRIFSDLGVRMVAQGEDFEIRAQRLPSGEASWWDARYNSPITATWKRDGGDVPLPDGSVTWQGVDDFATVAIFADGERLRRIKASTCFNGEAVKVGPEGPVSNPYPWGCPWNPYTLGSVMGVARDYSTTLLPQWGTSLRLRPGVYDLVASITPAWRSRLQISDADAVVTTRLVVKEARDRWRVGAAAARTQSGTDQLEPTTAEPTVSSQGVMVNEFAPDLRSLPAFDISLNDRGTALRFGATVWNGGAGPMVIEGFREDDHADHMTAYQYYFDGDGNQTGFDQVGEFGFHAANHDHWHFEDFARYRLLNPDLTAAVRSTKASFCLVATDAVDLTVPHADMRPEFTDLGSQCGGRRAESLRQVLANGHGDTYHQFRAGQAFRIGDLEDGVYYIAVEANPDDRDGRNLRELDTDNNTSYRKVRLLTNEETGQRRVKVFQVGIIDEFDVEGFFRRR